MSHPPFFHAPSGCVRFWVRIADTEIGASVSRETLHYSFRPQSQGEDPLETYAAFERELGAAVQRRVVQGALEPVMLREFDLRS